MQNNKLRILLLFFSFLIPLGIRIVPEIIAGPYPIGFDTVFSYVPWIKSGYPLGMEAARILKGVNLFPLLATFLNKYLVDNPVLTIKLLGPLLYGFLGLSMYIFSQRVLNWDLQKSLLLVVVYSIYFVSLRISWEMYRQMLGTIFLLLTLMIHRSASRKVSGILVPILAILTAFSHEITAVILTEILLIEVVVGLLKRDEKTSIAILSLFILALILCYMLYDASSRTLRLPLESFDEDRSSIALYVSGFLLYSYGFLLPFMLYGILKLRNRMVYSWLFFTFLFSIWPTIYPQLTPPLWFRWAIFMVYPISMLFVEGFSRILSRGSSKATKVILVLYLSFIVFTGTWYLVADPEHAFAYYSEYNPYKAYIQSSMLQSTIPIEDIEPAMQAMKWISENADGLVVFHEAFYPWAIMCDCVPEEYIIVRERDLSKPERTTFADALNRIVEKMGREGQQVYTVWWTNGKGWYNVPQLPDDFRLEISFENIGVYRFERERDSK